MLSRKIIYLILIISSLFFYIMFLGKLSFYLMVLILSLPAAMLIILIFGKFSIKCRLSPCDVISLKKEKCNFRLEMKNKTIFPFPTAEIKIKYKNTLSANTEIFRISVPIHALTSQTLIFSLSSEYCGIVNAEILHIKLYDYLKLFSVKIKTNTNAQIYVIPNVVSNMSDPSFKTVPDEESSEFSKARSGDDPSEIFELKDYVPGDKINRIHWNLSARQNQLVTKHYSCGVNSPVAVISDISFDLSNTDLPEISTALELLYTISFMLIENEIRHELIIKGISEHFCISDHNELTEFYINLLNQQYQISDITDFNHVCTKSKIFLISNNAYDNYEIPEIPLSSELKCFFTGHYSDNIVSNQTDNISILLIDAESLEKLSADIFI